MSKIAFITGAAGFIGRHTARELAHQGWRVAGIGFGDWNDTEAHNWGLDFWQTGEVTLDNLERLAIEVGEPAAIVHCAGSGAVGYSFEHPRDDFMRNVASTLDVLEFARQRVGAVRVVLPSSAAVYGAVTHFPIAEGSHLRPVSPYGAHKLMAEDLCRSYAIFWRVPVGMVRLFSVYGAGLRKQLLWDACRKARDGAFRFFGTGDELRDWLHVSDAAVLMALAVAHASPSCPVVNGGTGNGVSIREILTCFGRLWQPGLQPVFTGEAKAGDPAHYVADITQLESWGFSPSIPLETGLTDYIRWFLAEVEEAA